MTEFLADYVFVIGAGLSIALAVVCLYLAVSNFIESRRTLKDFKRYEKTQDEPVAKARRGGL